ncbi:Glutaminase A [Lachnellula hyalina]|uniref:Glutaminase A n=1 Tax=Lachnellula hyalina TaxID=1316788 RepID=A0A8H8TZR4_9HELO|nr:Glutaminase A [Lachnellula hyalina]TVY28464.1 Glutaminase A [Lachnellula hyalina]
MNFHFLVVALGTLVNNGLAATFSPARPPAIPLAVRSPYMNTWLELGSDGGSQGFLPGAWPRFWAGPQPGEAVGANGAVTGWTGLIKVDGASYTWMGQPKIGDDFPTNVKQTSFEYTSQRSTFIMNVAGKVSMNVTFISPIAPKDLKRQSIIGSYLQVTVAATDGATHSVQLYADTTAEWVSIRNTDTAQWSFSNQNNIVSHKSWRQTQSEFNADFPDDGSHWGNWYWSTAATPSLTSQSGGHETVRGNFLRDGKLPNTQDSNYRAISDNFPVFAFANDLSNVGNNPITTLYTIVHAQENAIQFDGANGIVSVRSLWTSYFGSDLAVVEFLYKDYSTVDGAIDHVFAVDSLAAGGQDYLTITSLSARQAFGGTQLCGTISKPYLFLKEISSDGNIQTVDVFFPAIPIFLYSNPVLVKYLLDPLFENQEAGRFPKQWSIHDMGGHYPQAIGHEDGQQEDMPVEECGNMIIATLAYAQSTSDTAYLSKHYQLLKQWAGFLVSDSLIPDNQLSTDDFQGSLANQTNLALKGIIGIEAMAVIARLTGNNADVTRFSNTAHDYIKKWQDMAVVTDANPPHTNLAYHDNNSHGLLYNLYADKLLGLNLVPNSIYDMQSTFYPTVADEFGVTLDTRNTNTKSDWQMWVAAISSPSTKTMFYSKLANWINKTPTNRAFTDLYNTRSADFGGGKFAARPVVGGHFAALALNGAPRSAGVRRGVEFKA